MYRPPSHSYAESFLPRKSHPSKLNGSKADIRLTADFSVATLTPYVAVNVSEVVKIADNSSFWFFEFQVWAPTPYIGDPLDFLAEPRPNIPACTWTAWSAWSSCTLNNSWNGPPLPCGVQLRNRTSSESTSCFAYDLHWATESQPCTIQCPVSSTLPSPPTSSASTPSNHSATGSEINAGPSDSAGVNTGLLIGLIVGSLPLAPPTIRLPIHLS